VKLAIWDAPWNDYVSRMYLAPLEQFARAAGVTVKRITDPVPEFGWTMICNAGLLNASLVQHFDSNHCPLVAISCNDSAYLTANIDDFFHQIPLLFTVSGVQKVNFSNRAVMNPDMTVSLVLERFLSDEAWERYYAMHQAGRLLPLPYVPWDRLESVEVPAQKTPKVLFRGGNHFWRFVAFLHALKAGVAHPASGFLTEDYFREDMVPQFRYCDTCRRQWRDQNRNLTKPDACYDCECMPTDLKEPLSWNNRTPRGFYRLAWRFFADNISPDGTMIAYNPDGVAAALNFKRQSPRQHLQAIADAVFFADCKWEFSIHTAQRFWEAASVGTVNLLPERANDQEHFPYIEEGVDYCTFEDSFGDWSDLAEAATWDTYRIAHNARALYEHWIKPSEYVTNTNLLAHILGKIQGVAG
jgi:hypothetical protein